MHGVRWLLLADVHANLEALDAALQAVDERWGRLPIACAGDLVGYGPNPNECIARLRARGAWCILGNHDLMVLERLATTHCVPAGIRAVHWTRARLQPEARQWLDALPPRLVVADAFVLCHGSLSNVEEYIADAAAAGAQLAQLSAQFPGQRLLVCGHTHAPVCLRDGALRPVSSGYCFRLPPGEATLINPGSVGQSRDRQALARYAIFDMEAKTVTFHAVAYDVQRCARKIRNAGLITPLYQTAGDRLLERGLGIARRLRKRLLR